MKQWITALVISALFTLPAAAQDAKRQKEFNLGKASLAISGYDPVAYFTQVKAVEGKQEFSAVHGGVTYRFSSQQNKAAFLASPQAYEPQYGGWCAYAMGAKGTKVEVDPETFKIVGGKLYLFYNAFFNNTLKAWNKNEPALQQSADAAWSRFYSPA